VLQPQYLSILIRKGNHLAIIPDLPEAKPVNTPEMTSYLLSSSTAHLGDGTGVCDGCQLFEGLGECQGCGESLIFAVGLPTSESSSSLRIFPSRKAEMVFIEQQIEHNSHLSESQEKQAVQVLLISCTLSDERRTMHE
jgi:hypothetical protein